MVNSKLCGFYRLPMARRREYIAKAAGLSEEDLRVLSGEEGLGAEQAETMTASLGIASYPLHARSRQDLIQQADRAMQKIKGDRKDGIGIAEVAVGPLGRVEEEGRGASGSQS